MFNVAKRTRIRQRLNQIDDGVAEMRALVNDLNPPKVNRIPLNPPDYCCCDDWLCNSTPQPQIPRRSPLLDIITAHRQLQQNRNEDFYREINERNTRRQILGCPSYCNCHINESGRRALNCSSYCNCAGPAVLRRVRSEPRCNPRMPEVLQSPRKLRIVTRVTLRPFNTGQSSGPPISKTYRGSARVELPVELDDNRSPLEQKVRVAMKEVKKEEKSDENVTVDLVTVKKENPSVEEMSKVEEPKEEVVTDV